MRPEFLQTVGDPVQFEKLLKGEAFMGHLDVRVAMVGKSNVGKSSLINHLLGERLAQVSAEPGKTRKLHFYRWPEARTIIADLPGYGFAKASHTDRNAWGKLVESYIKIDPGLGAALVLLDSRHPLSDADREAIGFLSDLGVRPQVVFTKIDSLKNQSDTHKAKVRAKVELEEIGIDPARAYWVSVKERAPGLKLLLDYFKKGLHDQIKEEKEANPQ
jgi:GTP-binding protein